MAIEREQDLFPIIKKLYKERGYAVYAEVAHYMRGIDLVAVSPNEHVAVELKMQFNNHLVAQARWDTISFDKVYIAYPVRKPVFFHREDVYWKLREGVRNRYDRCVEQGIGIYQVLPSGTVFEALEAKQQEHVRRMDYAHHVEDADDVGGLPCQKGVSAGYYELENIKDYVRAHPEANWQEIFEKVHTHYANARSLAGSMSHWRGFNLREFKRALQPEPPKQSSLLQAEPLSLSR